MASVLIALALSGCRSSLDQRFEFEPVRQPFEGGNTVSIITRGEASTIDSSGVPIDRAASPYWIGVYLDGPSSGAAHIKTVRFVSLDSRRVISPAVSATATFSDGRTRFVQLSRVALPFEDHEVTVHLDPGTGPQARPDSVRLFLRKRFTERRVSFWEWLSHL